MRHTEKRANILAKIGDNLKAQRLTVFRETQQDFANRMNAFGLLDVDASTVDAMENGARNITIDTWLCAFQIMQVIDSVAKSTKSDSALFLAAAKFAPNIEEEMTHELNKKKGSK
jgi:hypothetical protein